jgi:hypothetical protein
VITRILCTLVLIMSNIALNANNDMTHIMSQLHKDSHAQQLAFDFSYVYNKHADMKSGTKTVSSQDVIDNGYLSCPEKILTQLYIARILFKASDEWKFSLMSHYVMRSITNYASLANKTMEHSADGIGDTLLAAIYSLSLKKNQNLSLMGGVSLPTGSITKKNPNGINLPYPQEPGSGTYNIMASALYRLGIEPFTFLFRLSSVFYLGKNSREYALGNDYQANIDLQYSIKKWLKTSLQVRGLYQQNIRGEDPDTPKHLGPGFDPNNYGGKIINGVLGLDFFTLKKTMFLKSLSVNAGIPLYQNYSGIHPSEKWFIGCSLQFSLF